MPDQIAAGREYLCTLYTRSNLTPQDRYGSQRVRAKYQHEAAERFTLQYDRHEHSLARDMESAWVVVEPAQAGERQRIYKVQGEIIPSYTADEVCPKCDQHGLEETASSVRCTECGWDLRTALPEVRKRAEEEVAAVRQTQEQVAQHLSSEVVA